MISHYVHPNYNIPHLKANSSPRVSSLMSHELQDLIPYLMFYGLYVPWACYKARGNFFTVPVLCHIAQPSSHGLFALPAHTAHRLRSTAAAARDEPASMFHVYPSTNGTNLIL